MTRMLSLGFICALGALAQPLEVHFLSIGSEHYARSSARGVNGFERVQSLVKSARRVSDLFRGGGAVSGEVLISSERAFVGKQDIEDAISRLIERIPPQAVDRSLAVIYLTSHGVSDGIAWNHFSIPGDFLYRGDISKATVESLARNTIHAAEIVDRLEKAHLHFVLLLDSCYEGKSKTFGSAVLTPDASNGLNSVLAVLRRVNEFRNSGPVLFAAAPGTVVAAADDPEDAEGDFIGPLARRMTLLLRPAIQERRKLSLREFVEAMVSKEIDVGNPPAVTRSEPSPRFERGFVRAGLPMAKVPEVYGSRKSGSVAAGR